MNLIGTIRGAGVTGDQNHETYDSQIWTHTGGPGAEPFSIASPWVAQSNITGPDDIAGIVVYFIAGYVNETGATVLNASVQMRVGADVLAVATIALLGVLTNVSSLTELLRTQPNGDPWTLTALNALELRGAMDGEGHAGQSVELRTAELFARVYQRENLAAHVIAGNLGGTMVANSNTQPILAGNLAGSLVATT